VRNAALLHATLLAILLLAIVALATAPVPTAASQPDAATVQDDGQETPPNVLANPGVREVESKLNERWDISIPIGTLSQALLEIEKQSGIDMRPDWKAMSRERVGRDTPVNQLHAPNRPLGQTLEWFLDPLDLLAIARRGHVVVTTRAAYDKDDDYLEVRLYRSADLARGAEAYEQLRSLLKDMCSRAAWEDVDGNGGTIDSFLGMLVIKQKQQVHRQIEAILDMIRAASIDTHAGSGGGDWQPVVFAHGRDLALEAKLRGPLKIHLREGTTLKEAFEQFAKNLRITIQVDWEGALADEQIDRDLPVHLHSEDRPAHKALGILLRPLQLEAVTRGNFVYVTTQIAAHEGLGFLKVRVYRCGLARDQDTRDNLIDLITSMPDTQWGEKARFDGRITTFNDLLIIRQTPQSHAEIEETLNEVH